MITKRKIKKFKPQCVPVNLTKEEMERLETMKQKNVEAQRYRVR